MSDPGDSGPGGAQAELVARLRKAMVDQRMRQADLAAAADVSRAAVSTVLSGKTVPTLATLDLLAAALRLTGEALKELHRLRERADARTRRLDGYLAAARRAAQDQPYPGVLQAATPPLSSVYLRQQATPQAANELADGGRAAGAPKNDSVKLPAEETVTGGRNCMILAGPGGGKSSLLRTILAQGVERWLDGHGDGTVPVMVPAVALAGRPLAQAIGAFVNADLPLLDELPSAFFAAPPQAEVRWLVLVDGLDEVADPAVRRQVLRTLATAADGEQAGLYRFAVASRPLPGGELDILGPGLARYDLRPFDREELETVASNWFRALSLPAPEQAARMFIQGLTRAKLIRLARIPLMTAMLCQLHAANPDRPLPVGRGQIYREFTVLLHQRQHTPGPVRSGTQTASLDRYGPTAVALAEQFLDHLHDLIAQAAAERYRGNTLPVTVILGSHPYARLPPRVPPGEWEAFLRASLRRSGLLTEQAGELVFLHQTLLEYLAAYHATRTPQARARILRQILHHPTRYGPRSYTPPGIKSRLGLRRYWAPPRDDGQLSYVSFVLDTAHEHDPDAAARHLTRLASCGGLPGCRFIAALTCLGTFLPGDVLRTTADHCHDLAVSPALDSSDRLLATKALADLGATHAADLYHDLACDPTIDKGNRSKAAWALGRLGDPHADDLCRDLTNNPALDHDIRLHATLTLAARGDRPAADLCHDLGCDPTIGDYDRVRAAKALGTLGDPRAADLCYDLACAPALGVSRVEAAKALARLGDHRAADLLHHLARDPTINGFYHWRAVEALAELGDRRAADLCYDLGCDPTIAGYDRVLAAGALGTLGDPRAPDLYHHLADAPALDDIYRVRAAEALAELGDRRGADLCNDLARNPAIGNSSRVHAAKTLAELSDCRGAELCHDLAGDPAIDGDDRMEAAQALARLGDPSGTQLVEALGTLGFPSGRRKLSRPADW